MVETSKLDGPPYDQGYGPPVVVTRVGPPVELDEKVACQECFYGNEAKLWLYLCAYTSEGCDDGLRYHWFIDPARACCIGTDFRRYFQVDGGEPRRRPDEAVDTMALGGDIDGDADLLDADLEAAADGGGAPRARVDMRRRAVVRDVVSTRFAAVVRAARGAASRAASDDDEDEAPLSRALYYDEDEDEEEGMGYDRYSGRFPRERGGVTGRGTGTRLCSASPGHATASIFSTVIID